MREVHGHESGTFNSAIEIAAFGDDSYEVHGPIENGLMALIARIKFQKGTVKAAGFNGVSLEALLAICADRLNQFQITPYCCRENALAITHIEEALHWLHARTVKRVQRGVEGTTEL